MRDIIRFSIMVTVIIGVVFFALLALFAPQFIRAFINYDAVVSLGTNFLRIFVITTPFSGILFTLQFAFQGMGKAVPGMVLTVGRQALFLLVVFLGASFGGMFGIISAQPISVAGALILAIILYAGLARNRGKNRVSGEGGDTNIERARDRAPLG
jgi:Na+-driven multidrug efflux pump